MRFHFKYEHLAQSEREIIDTFMDYVIAGADKKCGAFAKGIKRNGYLLEDGKLVVFVLGEKGAEVLNDKTAARFSAMLEENFGICREVVFVNHEEDYRRTIEEVKESLEQAPWQKLLPQRRSLLPKKQSPEKDCWEDLST